MTYSASSVPILQLGISGKNMTEQMLNDAALNTIRPQLSTVQGTVMPAPYGGKQRQVSINLDQAAMQSKGIAPADLLSAHGSTECCYAIGHDQDRQQRI